jgi:hypothetical protein
VTRVLTDDALRERLITAGRARPSSFSWDRAARETLACWQRALTG